MVKIIAKNETYYSAQKGYNNYNRYNEFFQTYLTQHKLFKN